VRLDTPLIDVRPLITANAAWLVGIRIVAQEAEVSRPDAIRRLAEIGFQKQDGETVLIRT
jgi:hypothetical protein